MECTKLLEVANKEVEYLRSVASKQRDSGRTLARAATGKARLIKPSSSPAVTIPTKRQTKVAVLTGGYGVGKSALAAHLAAEHGFSVVAEPTVRVGEMLSQVTSRYINDRYIDGRY